MVRIGRPADEMRIAALMRRGAARIDE